MQEDKIKIKIIGFNVVHYEYCPGNGTRYEIAVSKLNSESVSFGSLGTVTDGWLVICGLTRKCYMLQDKKERVHENYIKDKFDLHHTGDVKYVTELINYALGRV